MALFSRIANALKSATTIVDVSAATAPTNGQVLTATGGTTATWQSPGGGGDMVITALPGNGVLSTATLAADDPPFISFGDGVTAIWRVSVKVPAGGTSISSIKVYYKSQSVITNNLYLLFQTWHVDADTPAVVQLDQTDSTTTYAAGGNDSKFYPITVPAGAYNGLTGIAANDIIGILVYRAGADASDTYGADWLVASVEFTFA